MAIPPPPPLFMTASRSSTSWPQRTVKTTSVLNCTDSSHSSPESFRLVKLVDVLSLVNPWDYIRAGTIKDWTELPLKATAASTLDTFVSRACRPLGRQNNQPNDCGRLKEDGDATVHLHLFLNRGGRWGTSFLHFSLFSTALWDSANSRPVHSLALSSHLFVCLPCLLPPFTVPCKMVLDKSDGRETAVCVSLRSSGGLRVVQLPAGSWHGLHRW